MKKRYIFLILLLFLTITGCQSKEKENGKDTSSSNSYQISNVGYFIEDKDGNLYYWQLNENSRENTALLANFMDSKNAENELIKVDKKGKKTIIYKGNGNGKMVIAKDRLYINVKNNNQTEIMSMDLNGKDIKQHGAGMIEGCGTNLLVATDGSKLISFNIHTQDYNILKENAEFIYKDGKSLYYGILNTNNSYDIYKYDYLDENTYYDDKLATVNASDFDTEYVTDLHFEYTEKVADKRYIYIGYRDGSANLLNGLVKVTVADDNKTNKEIADISQSFITKNVDIYYNETEQKSYIGYILAKGLDEKLEKLMTLDELAQKCNFNLNEESTISIYNGNALNNDVYFIADYGIHDLQNDIGWRYAYKREKTLYLKYNIVTNKLEIIYEF